VADWGVSMKALSQNAGTTDLDAGVDRVGECHARASAEFLGVGIGAPAAPPLPSAILTKSIGRERYIE